MLIFDKYQCQSCHYGPALNGDGLAIVETDDDPSGYVRRGFLRTSSALVEQLDERTVNGTSYEDVIRVEVEFRIELYPDFQNGDDSPVRIYDCEYWFAKGIGMIETSDRNFKRTI